MHYFQQWEALPVNVSTWQTASRTTINPLYRTVAEIVHRDSQSILDVGCGIGLDANLYMDIYYVGLDVTPKFVKHLSIRGTSGVTASALCLPFSDDSFDTVYANSLLVHLPPEQWKICLAEMVRVASKQVVTIEGEWKAVTEYVQAEHYGPLSFWNNAYSEAEVRAFMGNYSIQVFTDGVTQATIYNVSEE